MPYIIHQRGFDNKNALLLKTFLSMTLKSVEKRHSDAHALFVCDFGGNCKAVYDGIRARSLVNFYGQYADRHMNLKFMRRVSEREREIRQFVVIVSS